MQAVQLSDGIYDTLQQRAAEEDRTPDQVAEALLQTQLRSPHPYVQVVERFGGPSAVIRGTRVSVSDIVGYLRPGETPETLVASTLPRLTLAQLYDALSYYHDHQEEIETILHQANEAHGRAMLRAQMDEAGYRRLTGQEP